MTVLSGEMVSVVYNELIYTSGDGFPFFKHVIVIGSVQVAYCIVAVMS